MVLRHIEFNSLQTGAGKRQVFTSETENNFVGMLFCPPSCPSAAALPFFASDELCCPASIGSRRPREKEVSREDQATIGPDERVSEHNGGYYYGGNTPFELT